MRNRYEIQGDVTVIFLQRGMTTVIDTVDLPKACSFPNQWRATKRSDGKGWYVQSSIRINGKRRNQMLHRWLTDAPRDMQVDHRDHDGLNNRRISNLRVVTQSQNQQNRKGAIGKTGHRGVYPKSNGYKVEITVNNKRFYFGFYFDIDEAAEVAAEARRRLMPFTQEVGQQNDDLWNEISSRYLNSA